MSAADVTICIPTWQSEAFIARTLACARAQTHKNLRILVSVDQSTDGTEAICRHVAKEDPRLDIRVQKERLGWAQNTNFLLDQIDTEFCFLYFDDDVLEPAFTERLREILLGNPEVCSAHCDMETFGNRQVIMRGCDFDGTAAERIIKFLLLPLPLVPLRSLLRSEIITKGLRFPLIGEDSFWRPYPFLMNFIAAGTAKRVPEILYRRWERDGSITKGWSPKSHDPLIEGQQQNAKLCLDVIRRMDLTKAETELVTFCLYVSLMTLTRKYEERMKSDRLVAPEVIAESFGALRLPANAPPVEPGVFENVLRAYAMLLALEASHHWEHGKADPALLAYTAALSLYPTWPGAHAALGKILSAEGQQLSASAVRHRFRTLRNKAG
jgi:glycosyltransferase involved in cell wall biosynthesis